ncbi:NADP-dependent oxidoreductase [Lentzea terrae]|uniref:NADP-dependent oxidoreductase n=1 Tax=Lentzea terrae TaxID=2200761 RepID=UPI000DD39B1C|nr:NADP-dependent oxidoreductase [Lentzea terrae]
MRAVRTAELLVVDVPEVVAGPGEVLVRTVASSINPVDDKTRQGIFGEVAELGWDLAGVVVEGAGEFTPGDRVVAMSNQLASGRGTWAELVTLPADLVAPAPKACSFVEAATLPLAGLTALQTLEWLQLEAGQRLLVAGAAGAVGDLATQLARARGVQVDTLTRENQDIGREYDAVFDTYGAFVVDSVRNGGRYASIASQAGPVPERAGVRTTNIEVREDGEGLRELVKLVDDGVLQVRVDSTFAVRDVQAAHERFRRGGLNGKVTLLF